jgi:hypothetical protein
MPIRFEALPTKTVRALQRGGRDAYGHQPERRISDGDGVPCRHCLEDVAAGGTYLVVAHRPFDTLQPYAETGPIFLHASECERAPTRGERPPILSAPDYIVRGYDSEERIVYGTGAVIPTDRIPEYADRLLGQERIAFVHIRSARNNCFQCRVERANSGSGS